MTEQESNKRKRGDMDEIKASQPRLESIVKKTKYGNVIVEDIDDVTYATVTIITGQSELDIECKVIYKNEDNVELVFMMEEEVE